MIACNKNLIIHYCDDLCSLKKQHLFVFNIASDTEVFSVVVRKQSQLSWQASLKIGATYTCYNLRRTRLYQVNAYLLVNMVAKIHMKFK